MKVEEDGDTIIITMSKEEFEARKQDVVTNETLAAQIEELKALVTKPEVVPYTVKTTGDPYMTYGTRTSGYSTSATTHTYTTDINLND